MSQNGLHSKTNENCSLACVGFVRFQLSFHVCLLCSLEQAITDIELITYWSMM